MEPVTISLHDRRERLAAVIDLVTHGAAAVSLLSAAGDALSSADSANRMLAFAELLAGGLLLASILREVRQMRRGGGREAARVSWVNFFAAAVIFCEVWQRVEAGGKFSVATFLTGLITLAMGVLHPRLAARRAGRRVARLDDSGFDLRLGKFRRFTARWEDVEAVHFEPTRMRFALRDGRTRVIGLRVFDNREEIVSVLARCAAQAGVRTAGAAIPPEAVRAARHPAA